MGQHRVGPLGVHRPDQLARSRPGDLPVEALRHLRMLVRLRHRPPRRQAGDPLHRHRRRLQDSGTKHCLPGQFIRPPSPRVGQARLQPRDPLRSVDQRHPVPRSDHGVAPPGQQSLEHRDRERQESGAERGGDLVPE